MDAGAGTVGVQREHIREITEHPWTLSLCLHSRCLPDILQELLRLGDVRAIPQIVKLLPGEEAMIFPGEAREYNLRNEAPTAVLRLL